MRPLRDVPTSRLPLHRLTTPLPCALRAGRKRPLRAPRVSPPATSRRIPDTQTSAPGRGRCAGSRRGGLPRTEPPRPAPRSKRNRPLRSPSGEAPDPLARLFARELAHGLPDHLLEAPDSVVDHVRDEGLQVVELLPGRRQLAPSFLVLGLRPPVALLIPGRHYNLFLAAELLESGDADVDGIPQGTRLGPRLRHPDQVRSNGPVDVLRRGVPDARELALLRPDDGFDDGDLTVLLARNLQELRLDAPEPPVVRLLQKPRIEHEPLALALDHVLFPHARTSSSQRPVTLSSLTTVRVWSKITIRRSARRYTGGRQGLRSRCGGGSGRVSRAWSPGYCTRCG